MPLLMGVPGAEGNLDAMLEDDAGLEAELADLVGGGAGAGARGKARAKGVDLDAMVASCMRDYGSEEDMSDTEDPDLLAELAGMGESPEHRGQGRRQEDEEGVGHSLLQTVRDRLVLYREAEQVATAQGETSRAKRAGRGLKTLQELERRAVRGGAVREEEIPPPISTGS